MESQGMTMFDITEEQEEIHQQPLQQMEEDDVMVDIEAMIQQSGDGLLGPNCCISRVPYTLRDIKPNAYTPKYISIGPFHCGQERLQDMERHKQVFLKRFKQRTNTSLEDLVCFVRSSVPKVRASYSENINLNDSALVKLILLDAAFIIEFFISSLAEGLLVNDAMLPQQELQVTIIHDLVLLDNQLPFFVIEELFNKAFFPPVHCNLTSFCALACELFSQAFDLEKPTQDPYNESIKHFTDLLRLLFLQRAPPKTKPYSWTDDILLHGAKQLQEFGVKFKASKSKSLLDINFSGHVLELPHILVVEPMTETLFHNMIAFEQRHCPLTTHITNYAIVLNTKEDADVLIDTKIMRSFEPDTEVVSLFRIMGQNVYEERMISEYFDIFKALNEFYENPLNQGKATLRGDYCRTPWQTVASFAGIIILILTFLQTIFSILK